MFDPNCGSDPPRADVDRRRQDDRVEEERHDALRETGAAHRF
jgi:hypothetical protein